MQMQFLLITLRSHLRNKEHSLINIFSIAIGLIAFALSFVYVKHEFSYDRSWANAHNIHRLVIDQQNPSTGVFSSSDTANHDVLNSLLEYFRSEIETGARSKTAYVSMSLGGERFNEYLSLVDSSFIDIFSLDVVAGSLASAIGNPRMLAVDESVARRFFGPSPLGRRVLVAGEGGAEIEFVVGAVFRSPSHISNRDQFRILSGMHQSVAPLFREEYLAGPNTWMDDSRIWLRLKPETDPARLQTQLPNFVDRHGGYARSFLVPGQTLSEVMQYRLQPLHNMYLNAIGPGSGADLAKVLAFALGGLLVLLVGCSNSISLSLATLLERRREVGIRKSAGALRRDILFQFLGESLFLTLLALVPALLILELLLPAFTVLLSSPEPLQLVLSDIILITAIAILIGLLNGLYPALVMSEVRPVTVLKVGSGRATKGAQTLRQLLVGGQFTFALIFIIGALGIYLQIAAARAQPLGYDPSNLLIVESSSEIRGNTNVLTLLEELKRIPGVVNADVLGAIPNRVSSVSATLVRHSAQQSVTLADIAPIGFETFELLQIPLLAGRSFSRELDGLPSYPLMPKDSYGDGEYLDKVLLNRRAMQVLGFDSLDAAIGQLIYRRLLAPGGREFLTPYQVIGVVEDSMYLSLRRKAGPEMYFRASYEPGGPVLLRFEEAAVSTLTGRISQVWEQVTGLPPQTFTFAETLSTQEYIEEVGEGRVLFGAAVLTLFLSCVGLYGLAAFTMKGGIKEVGIRKAVGASAGSVIALFLWRFARPIVVANLIAWPLASYFLIHWIEQFPYQIAKFWLLPLCLFVSVVVFSIALFTVGGITARAAHISPVKSLRYE